MYSVDSRRGSGLYIISDSRFTWGNSANRWDGAQKTFASRTTPDIFGFCGDAFFPPSILRTLIDLGDSGCVFSEADDAKERHRKIVDLFKNAISREVKAMVADPPKTQVTDDGSRQLIPWRETWRRPTR
jgi:hypothetical protein